MLSVTLVQRQKCWLYDKIQLNIKCSMSHFFSFKRCIYFLNCQNKIPQRSWLKTTKIYSLIDPEGRNLKSANVNNTAFFQVWQKNFLMSLSVLLTFAHIPLCSLVPSLQALPSLMWLSSFNVFTGPLFACIIHWLLVSLHSSSHPIWTNYLRKGLSFE